MRIRTLTSCLAVSKAPPIWKRGAAHHKTISRMNGFGRGPHTASFHHNGPKDLIGVNNLNQRQPSGMGERQFVVQPCLAPSHEGQGLTQRRGGTRVNPTYCLSP